MPRAIELLIKSVGRSTFVDRFIQNLVAQLPDWMQWTGGIIPLVLDITI